MTAPQLFDCRLILQRRARAALAASPPDFLLRRVAEDIRERIEAVERQFSRVLCLGAYHGVMAEALPEGTGGEIIVAAEASQPLAARCPGVRICADEALLPFRDGAFDLAVSALSLHLVNDVPGALAQIRRALKPDGLFLGAVLGGDTLRELREAFMLAEIEQEGGASAHVAPMAGIRDYGALLQRAGFALSVADVDVVDVTYRSPLALMHDLRGMAAANPLTERRKRFLRRATLTRAMEIYRERFAAGDGRIRATFEVIHLSGWVPHESQKKPLSPGSAQVHLSDALAPKK
ncbi:MAG: methyltransferase domain-containing protein [Alphaproteobacteria bacterium]